MLPCHSCYICGTWRRKEIDGLKPSYGRKKKSHKKGNFYGPGQEKYPGS